MTKKEWTIIGALGAVVVFVFLCLGYLMFGILANQSAPSKPVAVEVVITATPEHTAQVALRPTDTPRPTTRPATSALPTRLPATVKPTNPPTPAFAAQTQKLGPIRETERDEQYTVQVTVTDVRYPEPDMFSHPKSGMVYVVVSVVVQNSGPGTIHSLYTSDFQVKDASGALRGDSMLAPDTRDCGLDLVDLSAGGSISGCIGFEVPASGRLEFIYAPYKYEGLKPGRYLSFVIRR